MTHLFFNQEFCFTVAVSNKDSENLIKRLKEANFRVQNKVNVNAPAMVDITVLCQKGFNDAAKAVSIINS